MLKNLALAAWSLSLLLIVACSSDVTVAGGGSIDPNANRGLVNVSEKSSSSDKANNGPDIPASSSSEAKRNSSKTESSSSNDRGSNNLAPDIHPSSSDDEGDTVYRMDTIVNPSVPDTIYYLARNFSAQCIIDYVKVDSAELVPVTDEPVAAADVLGASAYKSVDGDSVNIYLDGAYLNTPCDSAEEVQFFEEINSGNKIPVGLVNDILQMTLRWDKTCACAATVSFTLDKPSKDFNYIIFDLWRPIPFQER
ncbi:MAG: hypothetical protein IKN70_12665 [Fibrobacter sp.]|nr:hypothetical protein [Fibrobacter sp.]